MGALVRFIVLEASMRVGLASRGGNGLGEDYTAQQRYAVHISPARKEMENNGHLLSMLTSQTPQVPSHIPQIPLLRGHKDSNKGPYYGGPGCKTPNIQEVRIPETTLNPKPRNPKPLNS